MPLLLFAGMVTAKLPSAATVTVVKVAPPSVLTCTGVPVSIPNSALPLAKVKLTVMAISDGLLKSTLNLMASPSVTLLPVTLTVGRSPSVLIFGSLGSFDSSKITPVALPFLSLTLAFDGSVSIFNTKSSKRS